MQNYVNLLTEALAGDKPSLRELESAAKFGESGWWVLLPVISWLWAFIPKSDPHPNEFDR